MLQPLESGVRMENICMRRPENIEDIDVETVGYHRKCYQNVTHHLDRLKPKESTNLTTSRSPRKELPSNVDLFPDECIFCNRLEKLSKTKTDKCIQFPVFKSKEDGLKEPSWKKIEQRTLKLGLFSLHRKIQEDLFAKEAKFHQSCLTAFNLQYTNLMRNRTRESFRISIQQ